MLLHVSMSAAQMSAEPSHATDRNSGHQSKACHTLRINVQPTATKYQRRRCRLCCEPSILKCIFSLKTHRWPHNKSVFSVLGWRSNRSEMRMQRDYAGYGGKRPAVEIGDFWRMVFGLEWKGILYAFTWPSM